MCTTKISICSCESTNRLQFLNSYAKQLTLKCIVYYTLITNTAITILPISFCYYVLNILNSRSFYFFDCTL